MTTILLAEDEANQRLLYQMELEDEGYHVVLASDGSEALHQVEEEHPDLVVLDLKMPGMDAVEVLGQMKTIDSQLPVIIYSAYERSCSHFMPRMIDAYVTKSSDPSVLKGEISRLLSGREQQEQAPGRI